MMGKPKRSCPTLASWIKGRDYSDRDFLLIGGGPSLSGFDWGKLQRSIAGSKAPPLILTINFAHRVIQPSISYIQDSAVLSEAMGEEAYAHGKFLKVIHESCCEAGIDGLGLDPRICYIPVVSRGFIAWSSDPDAFPCHGNSGLMALNIACAMRGLGKRIFLLGYDLKVTSRRSNFHDWYKPSSRATWDTMDGMRKEFEAVRTMIQDNGIFSLSPVSPFPWLKRPDPDEMPEGFEWIAGGKHAVVS